MQFADDFKEQVRAQTDLVALIGSSIALQPRHGGREFVGLCPFHDDHNPSFRVYPERQSYRCWVCNEGGDCFSFVMQYDRVGFREALEMLAQRAGLTVPQSVRRQGGDGENRNRQFEILAWAEKQYQEALLSAAGERARRYLASRHLSQETIASFKLGYHPNDWNWLLERARARGYSAEELQGVRLVGKNESGRYYDNFVDRVLFPIHDTRGRPVGFGGRILPDASGTTGPKYWNSPEYPLFNKSKLLFALDSARDAIVKSDTVVVMEGYTDVIMAHQSGLKNTVATLGTAATDLHVSELRRFARKVVLVYDGDQAGQDATERVLPKFLAQAVDLRILTLPGGLDPADYLADYGPEAFTALIEGAVEAWEHKYRTVVARFGMESIDARHRVLQSMLEVLAQVPLQGGSLGADWQIRETVIIGRLSQRLSVPETTIRQQLGGMRGARSGNVRAGERNRPEGVRGGEGSVRPDVDVDFPQRPSRQQVMERELVELLFCVPAAAPAIREEVCPEDVSHSGLRQLIELCFEMSDGGEHCSYERVTAALEDPRLKRLAALVIEHAQQVRVTSDLLGVTLDYFRQQRELAELRMPPSGGPQEKRGSDGTGASGVSGTGLSADVQARLRQATELNLKRAAKKTLT